MNLAENDPRSGSSAANQDRIESQQSSAALSALTAPEKKSADGRDLLVDLPTIEVTWPVTEITTKGALEALAKRLSKERIFSVDTETGGEKGESIDTRLAVIQIGIPHFDKNGEIDASQGEVFLVDVLALRDRADAQSLKNRDGIIINPLAPLREVLEAKENSKGEEYQKLIHHAQFERGQFAKYGIKQDGVVDTKELAKKLRPEMESVALAACCVEFLGMSLSKEEQTSDWLRRPLTQSQKDYAALDAQVLFTLYVKLNEIERANRIDRTASPEVLADNLKTALIGSLESLRESGIGNEYMTCVIRAAELKKALEAKIRSMIPEGEKEFKPEAPFFHGSATVTTSDQKRINPEKFEDRFPDIAKELAGEYTATKKDVEAALRQLGFKGGRLKEEIDGIFSEQKWNRPSLKTQFSFAEYYGTAQTSLEKEIGAGHFSTAKLTPQRIFDIQGLAREVRPDLLDHSLEACALEVLGADIRVPTDKLTAAAKKKYLAKVEATADALEEKLSQMQAQIKAPMPDEPDELLREIIAQTGQRLGLLRNTNAGTSYGPSFYRAEQAAALLIEKLSPNLGEHDSRFDYPTPSGNVALQRGSRSFIDLESFRANYSDIAHKVLRPPKGKIQEAMDRRHIDRNSQAQAFKEIEEITGQSNPSFSCYPRFKLLYVPGGGHDSEPIENDTPAES